MMKIRETVLGEGSNQVEGYRRMRIGLQHPLRIRFARFRCEGYVVDDVAPVRGQRPITARLHIRGARLCILAGKPADALGTTVGALLGTSTVTSYIESATGIEE